MAEPLDEGGIDDFLGRFRDVESAWALLGSAENLDEIAAAAALRAAVAQGAMSSPVLVRAAALLGERGLHQEARAAIERALAIDGPAAPAQIAYARQMRATGDLRRARAWYRSGLLRARPEVSLLLEYAGLEQALGATEWATRIGEAAHGLQSGTAGDLCAVARGLSELGRDDLAAIGLAEAWRRGDRSEELLARIAATKDGLARPLAAPLDPAIPGGPTVRAAAAAMLAHGQLAASSDRAAAVIDARSREASPAWVPFDRLAGLLGERIARRAPFAWIRLGDGEARFLLHHRHELRAGLDDGAVRSIVGLIWSVWFGQEFSDADPARISMLGTAFEEAVAHADLLGISSAERLASDQMHAGYCTALETYLAALPPDPGRRYTDAAFSIRLHESVPFFGQLLAGQQFLGVISPHPDLAARLQRQLGIGQVISYDIPGEGRLGRVREQADRGRHFPEVYDRLMAELSAPFPGAVFLVAGGLLGKIYCDRIKALGGIALDIGALADAWMGINTRGQPLDQAIRAVLPA